MCVCQGVKENNLQRSQHEVACASCGDAVRVVLCVGGPDTGHRVHSQAVWQRAAPGRGLHLWGVPVEETVGDDRFWSVYCIPVLFSLIPVQTLDSMGLVFS